MPFSKVFSAQQVFLEAKLISVEVDISEGLYKISIIGLADKAVEEAKDRIASAIKHSGFGSPKHINHKITISLAPAHIKKSGALFDLPIALAYLKATKEISFDEQKKLFVGELSLDGRLRPIENALAITKFAQENGFEEIYIPFQNRSEASLVKNIKIFAIKNLSGVVAHLQKKSTLKEFCLNKKFTYQNPEIDFANIVGQEKAKRGLLIAISGNHNIGLYGPPGTGKTMLARASAGILPNLTHEKIIETSIIHSALGRLADPIVATPPFRSPHHSASHTAIIGGANLKPGEITLAHNGILFLDEFPEFDRRVIEVLRQPLEDRTITISRGTGSVKYPANFTLIIAMNPCPCGYYLSNIKNCTCGTTSILKYQKKISGPIIDRIDLWVEVSNIKNSNIFSVIPNGLNSTKIQEVVKGARDRQRIRFKDEKYSLNSQISADTIKNYCYLGPDLESLLVEASNRLGLSARSIHKILRLARTIADLDSADQIKKEHVFEALQFRPRFQSF